MQGFELARRFQQLANEAGGHLGRTSPPVELVSIAATPEPPLSSPAVAPTCPNDLVRDSRG